MNNNKIVPVIMCGGRGSRLWPLSRESFPKQYLKIKKGNKFSLLQNTIIRLKGIENITNPIIICNEEHRFILLDQLEEIDIDYNSIILEPTGKNTAPAITVAALQALQTEENPNLLILASDHEIKNDIKFVDVVQKALEISEKNLLVTFGIIPTHPETGYGYIEVEENFLKGEIRGLPIKKFVEKPTKSKAEEFVSQKRFFWNSGMFLFKAKTILKEIDKYYPDIRNHCSQSLLKSKKDLSFIRLDSESFKKCIDISIDVAVMEKTSLATVFPLDAGWSDIGSWKSVWETEEKDKKGNVSLGKVLSKKSENCYFRSENRLVVGIGIKNLIIVETNDAILIANKEFDQEVKYMLKDLERKRYEEGKIHKKIFRPWGNYISLAEGKNWQVKRIEVRSGGSLSLQLHNHRSEHWIIVKGKALIEIDEKQFTLIENQSTYIPLKSKHRLSNPSEETLVLIEVQSGNYLGEDDIIRIKDIYGR